MSLIDWLTNPFRRSASRGKSASSRPRFRPMLETLEQRWVPSTLTVQNNLDSGAGSLRAVVAAAHSGDAIVFAPSLNGQTISLTSGELLIKKNLTITGPGADQLSISGNHLSRVFEVASGVTDALSGMTISNGQASSGGSGILNSGTLTVNNCSLSNNSVGGIANEPGGALTLNGCMLSGNSALSGGGIYNYGNATLTVSNSTVVQNTATGDGGGIFNEGKVTISGCTLAGNKASTLGGGIYSSGRGSTLTITGSSLLGNSASSAGGGIFVEGSGTLSISGSTLSGNSAVNGGGIDLYSGAATVSGCTLTANSATYGGGIYDYTGTLTVSGSTLGGSNPADANVASAAGGGIYISTPHAIWTPTVIIENSSTIIGNTAPVSYGADVYNLGVLHLDASSIIGILAGNPPS
jgi:predicted outer membrane repeat protein